MICGEMFLMLSMWETKWIFYHTNHMNVLQGNVHVLGGKLFEINPNLDLNSISLGPWSKLVGSSKCKPVYVSIQWIMIKLRSPVDYIHLTYLSETIHTGICMPLYTHMPRNLSGPYFGCLISFNLPWVAPKPSDHFGRCHHSVLPRCGCSWRRKMLKRSKGLWRPRRDDSICPWMDVVFPIAHLSQYWCPAALQLSPFHAVAVLCFAIELVLL